MRLFDPVEFGEQRQHFRFAGFSNICAQKRTHRCTLRSKRKVDVQWGLYALVHKIGKIHVFGALP